MEFSNFYRILLGKHFLLFNFLVRQMRKIRQRDCHLIWFCKKRQKRDFSFVWQKLCLKHNPTYQCKISFPPTPVFRKRRKVSFIHGALNIMKLLPFNISVERCNLLDLLFSCARFLKQNLWSRWIGLGGRFSWTPQFWTWLVASSILERESKTMHSIIFLLLFLTRVQSLGLQSLQLQKIFFKKSLKT